MTPFTKVQGLGNDFVLVEHDAVEAWPFARVKAVCDRHYGIGADGVLLLQTAAGCDAQMVVLNADGTRPEMCGNGLRCVALYLSMRTGRDELWVQTDAGLKHCVVDGDAVTVALGAVTVVGEVALGPDAFGARWYGVDAGNPHVVSFEIGPEEVHRVGPMLTNHRLFPAGTNVECARISNGEIQLAVWERGAGFTLACGTGAAATAALAWSLGLLPEGPVLIHLPGGPLRVWRDGATTYQRGPAQIVFHGTLST